MATTPSPLSAGRLVVIEPPAGSLAPRRLVVAPAGASLPQGRLCHPRGGRASSRGEDAVAAAAGSAFASVGFRASAGDRASRGAPTAVGVDLVYPAVATGVLEDANMRGPRVCSFASAHGGLAVASAKGNGVASVAAATCGSLTGRVALPLAEAGAGCAASLGGRRTLAAADGAYVAVPAATFGSLTGPGGAGGHATRGGQAAVCFGVAGAGGQASRGGRAALSLTPLQVGGGGFPSPRRAGFAVPFVAVAAGAKSLNTGLLAGAGGLRASRGAYVVTAAAAGVPGEGAADEENVITPDGAPMEEPAIDVTKCFLYGSAKSNATRDGQATVYFGVAGAGGQASRGGQAALCLTALQVAGGRFHSPRRAGFAAPFVAVAAGAKSLNTGLLAGAGGLRASRGAHVVAAAAAGAPGEGANHECRKEDVMRSWNYVEKTYRAEAYFGDVSNFEEIATRGIDIVRSLVEGSTKEYPSEYMEMLGLAGTSFRHVALQAKFGYVQASSVVEAVRYLQFVATRIIRVRSGRNGAWPRDPQGTNELPPAIPDPEEFFKELAKDVIKFLDEVDFGLAEA